MVWLGYSVILLLALVGDMLARVLNLRGDFAVLMRSKEPDCCPYIHQMCRSPCKARHCLSQCILTCGSEGNPKCQPITCEEANPKQCEANPYNVKPFGEAHPGPGGDPSAWGPPSNNPFDSEDHHDHHDHHHHKHFQPGQDDPDHSQFAPSSGNDNGPSSPTDEHNHFDSEDDHDHHHHNQFQPDHSQFAPPPGNDNGPSSPTDE